MNAIESEENVVEPSIAVVEEVLNPIPGTRDTSPASGNTLNRAIRESQIGINSGIHRLLGILVVGGVLYTCYFASSLILPVVMAAFFAMLLSPLMRPFNEANKMSESISAITSDSSKANQRVVVQAPDRPSLLSTTPRVLASALAVVLLTYFFLLYGDSLLRRTLSMRSTCTTACIPSASITAWVPTSM